MASHLRKPLVIFQAADIIGMAMDQDVIAFQPGKTIQPFIQFIHLLAINIKTSAAKKYAFNKCRIFGLSVCSIYG